MAPSAKAPLVGIRIDLETRSGAPIKSGVYRYTEDPDFEILLTAVSTVRRHPKGRTQVGPPRLLGEGVISEAVFRKILQDPSYEKHAFNANFERICLSRWLGMPTGEYLDPANWHCSAIRANVGGVFGSLDEVSKALGTQAKKDAEGKRLIRLFSSPDRKTGRFHDTGVSGNSRVSGNNCWCGADHSADFKRFGDYCKQDVLTEADTAGRLLDVPERVQREYEADQRINDRGIRHHAKLSKRAVAGVEAERDRLMGELKLLTGLENPNSIQQLRGWLAEQGYPMESLNKEARAEALADPDTPADVVTALTLKGAASLSSVAKHKAALDSRSEDGRIRGSLQFYGAHTGREAGRGIQPQNLPRYAAPDSDRKRLLRGTAGADAPLIAKGTVRSSLVPAPGHVFVVADYNAIEARCLGWLSGERWVLNEFRGAGKIYEATAATMFGVDKDKLIAALAACGKCGACENCTTRDQGKVACIAEGQLVLTRDRGLVPIENVSRNDLVWDGVEWVNHDGVVCLGTKEVITYDGLTATEDHRVWTTAGENTPIAFGTAARRGDRLVQSGSGRENVRVADRYHDRAPVHQTQTPSSVRRNPVLSMWARVLDLMGELPKRDRWLRVVRGGDPKNTEVAGQEANSGEAAVHEPDRSELAELRRERDRVSVPLSPRSWSVDAGECTRRGQQELADRPDRQQQVLRSRKPSDGGRSDKHKQPSKHYAQRVRSFLLALRRDNRATDARLRLVKGADNQPSPSSGAGPKKRMAEDRSTALVYDLLNAGPRNRYTVSGKLVHNCLALGYAGGAGALVVMGAEDVGIDCGNYVDLNKQWKAAGSPGKFFQWNSEAHDYPELLRLRDIYRNSSPMTVRFWKLCAKAWDLSTGGTGARFGGEQQVVMIRDGHHNRVILPSGRSIWYRNARSVRDDDSDYVDARMFRGKGAGVGHTWVQTHGGKLCVSGEALVLTDRGWVKLRDVLTSDLVWDGVNYVEHDGLAHQGVKPVIDVEGVRMTPDHQIMQIGGWREAQQYDRSDWKDVGLPDSGGFRGVEAAQRRGRRLPAVESFVRLWNRNRNAAQRSFTRPAPSQDSPKVLRLHEGRVDSESHFPSGGRQKQAPPLRPVEDGTIPLHSANGALLEKLWGAGYQNVRTLAERLLGVRRRHGCDVSAGTHARPDRQRGELRAGKLPVDLVLGTSEQPTEEVYDLLNAGPLRRFTVLTRQGPMLVHNCENITQAVARDVLFDLILKLERMTSRNYPARTVMHVHDEVVLEVPVIHAEQVLADTVGLMGTAPKWAKTLPLRGEGKIMERYGK